MSSPEFTFVTPPRLVVGWGAATDTRLAQEAARLGRRPLVVAADSARRSGALDAMLGVLRAGGLEPAVHTGVPPEPTVDDLQQAMDAARDADSVIAVGGGSALDIGKGAAALAGTGVTARDYFHGKHPVPERGARPILAIPTTAGTGSEATWVTVLVEKETERKASIRGGSMMPATALLDAQLTVSCPANVTAASGMDAFVQAVEAYTSSGANPLTDALALEAARLTGLNVETAVREPNDRAAREAMLLGSYMAGVALNTSRLGLVHGLAHPIGALTGAPHGLLCGLLLPPVLRFNQHAALTKYVLLAEALGLAEPGTHARQAVEVVNKFIAFTEGLLLRVGIPTRLSLVGLGEAHLDRVAAESMTSGSTKANPRPVTVEDARAVAASCL
jgi:Alcohol dehydrogenase, class IV